LWVSHNKALRRAAPLRRVGHLSACRSGAFKWVETEFVKAM